MQQVNHPVGIEQATATIMQPRTPPSRTTMEAVRESAREAKDATVRAATKLAQSAKSASNAAMTQVVEKRRPIGLALAIGTVVGLGAWLLARTLRRRSSGPPSPSMRLSGGTPVGR